MNLLSSTYEESNITLSVTIFEIWNNSYERNFITCANNSSIIIFLYNSFLIFCNCFEFNIAYFFDCFWMIEASMVKKDFVLIGIKGNLVFNFFLWEKLSPSTLRQVTYIKFFQPFNLIVRFEEFFKHDLMKFVFLIIIKKDSTLIFIDISIFPMIFNIFRLKAFKYNS
jgi:hypothetical protein